MSGQSSIFVDCKRYGIQPGGRSLIGSFFSHPGFRFMCLYRACNRFSSLNPFSVIIKLWYKNLQVKYGYQIPHACKIGDGFFLGHYGNIVINQNSKFGKNCNVAQGVTIGNVSRGRNKGYPVIGDRVWIGANAVVVGNIRIGNNVLIAPLTFVNFDVPDNAVVTGNPGKIVSYNGTNEYIKHEVE